MTSVAVVQVSHEEQQHGSLTPSASSDAMPSPSTRDIVDALLHGVVSDNLAPSPTQPPGLQIQGDSSSEDASVMALDEDEEELKALSHNAASPEAGSGLLIQVK